MIVTPWGYSLNNVDKLPDFITAQEFNAFTNSKFGLDARIAANIPSATAAIRNYCGWHISPKLECFAEYRIMDLRDAFVGPDVLVQLPATFVSDIKSVAIDGENTSDFDLDKCGLLRIYDVDFHDRRSKISIVYDAGLDDSQITVIKELTAHRVTHAVSSSYGVMSEAAGGVSITYNASWAGNTRSTALPDDNREVLEPYRVKGVF